LITGEGGISVSARLPLTESTQRNFGRMLPGLHLPNVTRLDKTLSAFQIINKETINECWRDYIGIGGSNPPWQS